MSTYFLKLTLRLRLRRCLPRIVHQENITFTRRHRTRATVIAPPNTHAPLHTIQPHPRTDEALYPTHSTQVYWSSHPVMEALTQTPGLDKRHQTPTLQPQHLMTKYCQTHAILLEIIIQ